jgi:hypothetical protein
MATAVFAGAVGLYAWGWRSLRRRWTILNVPTSKARSVAMGLVELKGKARRAGEEPFLSPVRNLSCVWYRTLVERHSAEGRRTYRLLHQQEAGTPFYLEDDTGRVMVKPDGAEIAGILVCDIIIGEGMDLPDDIKHFCDMNAIPWRFLAMGNNITIKEWVVLTDVETYVLGEAVNLSDEAEGRRRRISALLRSWLKDPARKADIDKNRDGIIQPEEWDAAREEAGTQVLMEASQSAPEETRVVIRKPRYQYFLIASGGEEEALRTQGHPALHMIAGMILLGLGVWLLPTANITSLAVWVGALMGGITVVGLFRRSFK